jgi:transcriptional regulator with XRE-family HTH domain
MRKSKDGMSRYRPTPSPNAERAARFRRQMADFARGERLKGLRDARHLSQEDAAHEIGVSVKTVRSWEKGGGIKWPNAKAAGRFYGVDAESLVSRELPVEQSPDELLRAIDRKLNRLLEAAGLDAEQDRGADVEPLADDVPEPLLPSERDRPETSEAERPAAARRDAVRSRQAR